MDVDLKRSPFPLHNHRNDRRSSREELLLFNEFFKRRTIFSKGTVKKVYDIFIFLQFYPVVTIVLNGHLQSDSRYGQSSSISL